MLDFYVALLVSFWFLLSVLQLCLVSLLCVNHGNVCRKSGNCKHNDKSIQNKLKTNIYHQSIKNDPWPTQALLGETWGPFWHQDGPKLKSFEKVTWTTLLPRAKSGDLFFWVFVVVFVHSFFRVRFFVDFKLSQGLTFMLFLGARQA